MVVRFDLLVALAAAVMLGGCQGAQGPAPRVNVGRAPQSAPVGSGIFVEAAPAHAKQNFDAARVQVSLEPVVRDLDEPTHVTPAGDGSGRLFVVERSGRIRIVRNGRLEAKPFLDIRPLVGSRGAEQGLLSVAFHPGFRDNGRLYVNYTDRNGDTTIVRYNVSNDPDQVDAASAGTLLQIAQPAANHNGGMLLFGPDGMLYIGMGDGGGRADQFRNAQNMNTLLGKMLRIDVDGGTPYAIPVNNPFVGVEGARPEIWAYGLRNPWRYAFDRVSGDLFIADVGQDQYEEIDLQRSGSGGGQNYGWPIMEGLHCFPDTARCDQSGLELPIAEYNHQLGCSITGGYVYRGSAYPPAQGVYFFGDFCSGRLWSLEPSVPEVSELLPSSVSISSFGEDEDGELYVTGLQPGALYRLVLRDR